VLGLGAPQVVRRRIKAVKFQKLLPAGGIIAADLVLPPDLGQGNPYPCNDDVTMVAAT
jgi:hypothetical protein